MNCIFPIFSQLGWLFGWLTPFSPTDPLDPSPLGPLCQANGADHGSAQPFGQRVRKAWWFQAPKNMGDHKIIQWYWFADSHDMP